MTRSCFRLGGDIICQLAFGYPLNTQTEPTNRPFLGAMEAINSRWLGKKRVADFRKSVFTMIHTRTAMEKDAKHDLYAIALSDKGTGRGDSSDDGVHGSELWAEATFFINAGESHSITLVLTPRN
ncbi:hypothetical protein KVR01_002510 [Diaporthe batatas]|uniref:uncharacterized protein n=1 Tax=Diaporthe batatas TaxID=748121 RepID=UPI001D0573DE|nr:uncharacterized protein KVR01_002510 [Diaporthe batatas]KAG8166821.1 hypothetical protein KVR01_002510 [Diaporthe batatas]